MRKPFGEPTGAFYEMVLTARIAETQETFARRAECRSWSKTQTRLADKRHRELAAVGMILKPEEQVEGPLGFRKTRTRQARDGVADNLATCGRASNLLNKKGIPLRRERRNGCPLHEGGDTGR